MGRATSHFFGPTPWGPGEGSNVIGISKIFISNFVCVLTNKICKTYPTGSGLCHGGQKFNFSEQGHVAYDQIEGDGEKNGHK